MILIVALLPLECIVLLFERLCLGARCFSKLSLDLFQLYLHLLGAFSVLVLSILLDELLLSGLKFTDLLVDLHLLFVEGRFVLDALVEEQSELIRLVDAVNHHG